MKNSIEWHEKAIKNFTETVERERKEVKRKQERLVKMEKELSFSVEQLSEAKKRGLSGYDDDKLLRERTAR